MLTDDSKKSFSTDRRTFMKMVGATIGITGGLSGCIGLQGGGGDTNSGPIVFGQPAALTGKWDYLQPGVTQATKVAKKEINEAGGPLGRDLKIIRRDTSVDPQQARTVVTQMVNNDNAVSIIGLYSSEIVPLFEYLKKELKVPVNTPWPGSNFLDTRGGDKRTPSNLNDDGWVWRTVISDTVHTAAAARKALREGHNTVGVIHGSSAGARSWAEGFIQTYKNRGGTITGRVEVSEDLSSYQAALNRLFNADFEAFVVSFGLEAAITVMSDWAAGGYGGQPILSDPLASPQLATAVGKPLNGAWAASPTGKGPYYKQFLQRYKKAGNADLNPWTPPAWDAVQSTALAVQRAGKATPDAIEKNLGPVSRPPGKKVTTFAEGQEALKNGEKINFQGAASPVDFTEYGNVFSSVAIQTVKGNKFVTTDIVEAQILDGYIPEEEY